MKNVPLTAIAGQTCRLPLVVKNAEGTPIPLDAYDIYGAVDDGSPVKTSMAVALIEPGVACLSIPPLQTGRYKYDVFMRHQATSTETRLLRGAITVQSRVASLPPAQSTSEQIDIVLSPEHTVLEISLSPVTIVSAADWKQIQEAADRAERAAGQAEATLPALEREIAAARTAIEQEADQAARHAAAETAELIAATGAQSQADVREEASRATSAALTAISTAINQAVNNGINAIGQSITAGTGTISEATASGKSSIDTYVAATQADLARKSQANSWAGVNTFNAPLVANGGIILQPASAASGISTHMSSHLWGSTYCTERSVPYIGRWTSAAWAGNDCLMESYTVPDQSTYHHRLTCMARVDVAYLARRRNCMDEAKSRIACGIETRPATAYAPHAGTYPWDWASGNELRIVDTPRHAVRCMMIRHAYSVLGSVPTSWRLIYPGRLEDLHSLQIISRGTEWHSPAYIGCHAGNLYAVECSYSQATNPAVTVDAGQYSSIMSRGTLWVSRTYLSDRANQDKQDVPPAITIHAHTIPLRNWTTYKRWPEEQALLEAADKSWVDWRYVAASLDYTPAGQETVIVAANIGRHIYVSGSAQGIGLAASVYRPKAGDDTLLTDGVIVDIDTASTWLTHEDGVLHLTANTTGAERIASVWLYSASLTGTIYELQIHQNP